MTLLDGYRRFWPLTLIALAITVLAVVLIERASAPVYRASGTIRIASPEVDPSRSASRAINLSSAVAEVSRGDRREAFASDGGRDDFRLLQVSDNRLQVLASGDGAVRGVRAVLRALADVVAAQQVAADVDVSERIRPRLFIQVPEDDLGSIAAVEGPISGDAPEVIGTLVLENPLAGAANPLGGVATATRLVLLSITSDAGSQEVLEALPGDVGFSINAYDGRARELLTVTTTGSDSSQVLDGFEIVTAAVEGELQRRQDLAEVPRNVRLLVDTIAAPIRAPEVEPGLSGTALGLLVLGGGAALVLPAILREVLSSRRQSPPSPTRDPPAADAAERHKRTAAGGHLTAR